MKISNYLNEIQHAVETIIGEVHREYELVRTLRVDLERLTAETNEGYDRVEFLALNPELDDDGLSTAIYWDTYFGPDKDRYYKTKEFEFATQKLKAHELSIASLAGSILQYAKQGISLHYGKDRSGCPDARLIATMTLHEVIWQGRNQSIHWEDGEFNKSVNTCFNLLSELINPVFSEYLDRNMAYEVINLLGWTSFDCFASDMKLLDQEQ